jgi:cobalamin biosynthesis Mg chelatase CobN
MGNRPDSNDGWEFRGKGLFQCTGRDNTARLGKRLGISAEMAAEWLTDPQHALACACALFAMLKMAPAADAEDMKKQTLLINGGLNGLADRQKLFYIAMRALAAQAAPTRAGKFSTEADADHVLDKVTAEDLREAGSRTIAGADEVKSAVTGIVAAGSTASAALTQTQNLVSQTQDMVEGVKAGAGMLELVKDYWIVLAIAVLLILTLYFIWRAYSGAFTVIDARVDDARSGANIGR